MSHFDFSPTILSLSPLVARARVLVGDVDDTSGAGRPS
jgi:hypothetical protein